MNELPIEDLRSIDSITGNSKPKVTVVDKLVLLYRGSCGACCNAWHTYDADYFAVAFYDGVIRIWSVSIKEPVICLQGHNSKVFQIKWSPLG